MGSDLYGCFSQDYNHYNPLSKEAKVMESSQLPIFSTRPCPSIQRAIERQWFSSWDSCFLLWAVAVWSSWAFSCACFGGSQRKPAAEMLWRISCRDRAQHKRNALFFFVLFLLGYTGYFTPADENVILMRETRWFHQWFQSFIVMMMM